MKKTLKYLTLALFSMLFINSCCLMTSRDCNCEPPDSALTQEALDWITPYDGKTFFIFADSIGNLDSFRVTRSSTTEFFGGEECGTNAQVEIAKLSSGKYANLLFTTSAKENKRVIFNEGTSPDDFLGGELFSSSNNDVFGRRNTTATFNANAFWNGLPITTIHLSCADSTSCDSFEMQNILVSKEFGLMLYFTKDGRRWVRKG